MLIAIMANTAQSLPYTQYIVWTQVLPQYFDQQYARSFAYQFLIALSTNFIGYGLAGLTRRFIGELILGPCRPPILRRRTMGLTDLGLSKCTLPTASGLTRW